MSAGVASSGASLHPLLPSRTLGHWRAVVGLWGISYLHLTHFIFHWKNGMHKHVCSFLSIFLMCVYIYIYIDIYSCM